MATHQDRGMFDAAKEMASEAAEAVKEKATEAYHQVMGDKQCQDKMCDKTKQGVDQAANKIGKMRDKAGDKMHDVANDIKY